jgi:hypothetical protein
MAESAKRDHEHTLTQRARGHSPRTPTTASSNDEQCPKCINFTRAGPTESESAHPRKASATLIIASRFFRDHGPIPAALCPRESGDPSARRVTDAERTKRRAAAMAGEGVYGARPIAAKARGVDRRQTGLQHVTHAPATPWD